MGGTGAILLLHELRWEPELLRSQIGFMNTYGGRAAFLFLIANLGWTCDPIGLLTSVLTNANALFHGYILFTHPTFVSGRVQRLEVYDEAALLQDRAIDVEEVGRDPASIAITSGIVNSSNSKFEIAE